MHRQHQQFKNCRRGLNPNNDFKLPINFKQIILNSTYY